MDVVGLISDLGIPVALSVALMYGCIFLIKYITGDLRKDIDEHFDRQQSIIIKLIDSNKNEREEVKDMRASMDAILTLIQKLTGNGLADYLKKRKKDE